MNEIKITPEEIGKAAELIRKVAEGTTQPAEPLTSWEIAKIFQSTHTRIFNRISRFYNAEALQHPAGLKNRYSPVLLESPTAQPKFHS